MRSRSKQKQAAEATFVFNGSIKKLNASNVKQAPATGRTAIVTVDEVIEAPPNLARYAGQDITVELSSRRQLKVGDRMIFHAIGWLFGEGIAVHSLYEELGQIKPASKSREIPRATRKHFDDADLIISGKIVEVRLPKPASAAKKESGASQTTTRVSEHDPKWREAIVEVDQVHKGEKSKRQVVIRFPSSRDVAWRRAPKFQAGQEGFFILHKERRSTAKSGTGKSQRSSGSGPAFTVRDPQDFQPYSEAGGIKSLIESDASRKRA